jgi:uncharacterized Zn-finger protein
MPYSNSPQFTNPWTSAPPAQSHGLYASSHDLSPNLGLEVIPKQPAPRLNSNVSMGSYAGVPITTAPTGSPSMADVYGAQDLLTIPQDLLSANRAVSTGYGNEAVYVTAHSPIHSTYPQSATPYGSIGYVPAPVRSTYPISQDHSRRISQPSVPSNSFVDASEEVLRTSRQNSFIDNHDRGLQSQAARSFGDAIDASRGMIAMSQDTPRNIYGTQARVGRESADSYGFPTTHSTNSSISSSGTYPQFYGGSVESSVSDYSNAGSDIESVSSRTLPRPSGLLNGGIPPAPQSMMGQFSSKVSSSTQKRHKCKVCDKRFTRPSSLQTHMYSHTGEKPFSCEVEGCGRHFSVVSNLRRHRKVHKGEAQSDAGSEDRHSD